MLNPVDSWYVTSNSVQNRNCYVVHISYLADFISCSNLSSQQSFKFPLPDHQPMHHCPTNSLNSTPHCSFLFTSSTNASNFWVPPVADAPAALPIATTFIRAATARIVLLLSSAARSKSCLTVSLVTGAPRMVVSSAGVSSSKLAMRRGVHNVREERREMRRCDSTLISSDGSVSAGRR